MFDWRSAQELVGVLSFFGTLYGAALIGHGLGL